MEAEIGVGNLHDYGARWYDASIGRFTTVDPLASDYSFQSPYAYATNNPVLLRDIMGMGVQDWFENQKTGEVIHNPNEGEGWEESLGEDWAHLAKEGEITDPNAVNSGEPVDIWYDFYEAKEAKELMGSNGKEFKPIQQTVIQSRLPISTKGGQVVVTAQITEKSSYVVKGSVETGRSNLASISETNALATTTFISRQEIFYSNSALAKGMHIYDKIFPSHSPAVFKNWDTYLKPRKTTPLLQKYIDTYGTQ